MALSEPVLSGPGAGRTVTHGGSSSELKLAGEQSGGDWAVVEWRVPAGDEPPMHTHTREDETLYVLEGGSPPTWRREDRRRGRLVRGASEERAARFPVHSEHVRLLVTLEPAGAEYFFVPRDHSDDDPAKFGLIVHAAAPTK